MTAHELAAALLKLPDVPVNFAGFESGIAAVLYFPADDEGPAGIVLREP